MERFIGLDVHAASSTRAHYDRLTVAGTKPNLAKVTLARKIAAITLAMWKQRAHATPRGIGCISNALRGMQGASVQSAQDVAFKPAKATKVRGRASTIFLVRQ